MAASYLGLLTPSAVRYGVCPEVLFMSGVRSLSFGMPMVLLWMFIFQKSHVERLRLRTGRRR